MLHSPSDTDISITALHFQSPWHVLAIASITAWSGTICCAAHNPHFKGCRTSFTQEGFAHWAKSVIRPQMSYCVVRGIKAMGMDLAMLFVAKSMPMVFMLLTSSWLNFDLITLFAQWVFASQVE